MSKNLSKTGAVFFVAITIILLLIYGNPYAPPVIEQGNLKLTLAKELPEPYAYLYNKDKKILTISPWQALIKYDGKARVIYLYGSNATWFNGSDDKQINVENNKIIIKYSNPSKDPSEVRITFSLDEEKLNYKVEGNFSDPEKIEAFSCGVLGKGSYGEDYERILTPSDDVIENKENKSFTFIKGFQIPEINKNYNLMISNSTMLNISGKFIKIEISNPPHAHVSRFYVNPNETLTIKVQEPIELNLTDKSNLKLTLAKELPEPYAYLYNKDKKILTISPWQALIKYDGKARVIYLYGSNATWFNGSDDKQINVENNKIIIKYSNPSKDPSEVRITFSLDEEKLNYKVEGNFSDPEKIEAFSCGVLGKGSYGEDYERILTPSDDVIENKENKSFTFIKGFQIPEINKNYNLMISNSTMLNISGKFIKIEISNPPHAHVSRFYVNPNETLTIKVQEPIELNLTDKSNLKLTLAKELPEPYAYLYNKDKKILTISPWQALIKYDGKARVIYLYGSNATWFNGSDDKQINVENNKIIIKYSNPSKDPSEVRITFSLDEEKLNYKVEGNFSDPEKIEAFSCGVLGKGSYGEDYERILTPSDDVIENKENKSFTFIKGFQIPEINKNYNLMISNSTMLNISGKFIKIEISNPPHAHVSRFYVNPNETLTIKVQEPIELNLTDKSNLKLTLAKELPEPYAYLYNKDKKILTISPWQALIKYDGKARVIYLYGSNATWFNGSDDKQINVENNKIIIKYSNPSKDPSEVRITFSLDEEKLNYKVEGNFSDPEKIEAFSCGVLGKGSYGEDYERILTPSDDVIENKENKSFTFIKGFQIPEINKNYNLMISNSTMLNISGKFIKIEISNPPHAHVSRFYVNPNETLTIKVQEPIELNLTDKSNLKLTLAKELPEPYAYLYNKDKKILTISPWQALIKYDGKARVIYLYGSNATWFNGSDDKQINVENNKIIIKYSNPSKDPSEVRITFSLDEEKLNYKVEGNFSDPEKIEAFSCGVLGKGSYGEDYERILTPSDDVIENKENKSFTFIKGFQIPEINKNYNLMISNSTMLNISGKFIKIEISNPPHAHVSRFYVNPNETLTIKVQEPIELNLTQTYPITVSTSKKIWDGIHIYKNGTKILSLSTWEAIFKHDGRTQRLLSSLKYDEDYPNKLLFNYNNSAKITKISEIKQNNKTTGYEMNVSWVNESRDVQEIGFSIKIYENKSYAEIKYIYRTKNAYVNLEPLSYGISFDKNKFTYIKVVKNSEITGNIKRSPVENEKKGYLNFAGCEQGKCDKIIADQWFIDKGNKNYEKAVEIKGNFSRIGHYFTYNLVRFYMDDFKEPLKIYVD